MIDTYRAGFIKLRQFTISSWFRLWRSTSIRLCLMFLLFLLVAFTGRMPRDFVWRRSAPCCV